MENTFPPALVEKINSMKVTEVTAEFVKLGGVKMADASGYRVIIDRISQDIPFYRAFLKNAALTGSIVINNPFWWTADDKFFNYALASKLGVAIPPPSSSKLHERMVHDAQTVCQALGYDFNTVEFAVEGGVPYAIDFMNPAPDADVNSVGQENFEWVVNAVAELALQKALSDENPGKELRWAAFLAGESITTPAIKTPRKKKARA